MPVGDGTPNGLCPGLGHGVSPFGTCVASTPILSSYTIYGPCPGLTDSSTRMLLVREDRTAASDDSGDFPRSIGSSRP